MAKVVGSNGCVNFTVKYTLGKIEITKFTQEKSGTDI